MAQFGKRNAGLSRAVRGSRIPKSDTSEVDVPAALEAASSGKVPSWTTAGPFRFVALAIGAAAVLWYTTATYGVEIVRDLRLAHTWRTAYDLRAVDGSCRRVQLVITFCSAKIASQAEPDRAPVVTEFMMGLSSGGGEALVPVRSTVDPSAIAIAYSAETKLFNRTVTWLVVATSLLLLLMSGVSALWLGHYKGGRAHLALLNGLAELQARAATPQPEQRAAL